MKTLIFEPSTENIIKCAHALKNSDLVAMPTETVYGLAANCFDEDAVEKVFKVKERPTFDPLIVHVNVNELKNTKEEFAHLMLLSKLKLIDLTKLTKPIMTQLEHLMKTFWPGPLTFVLPKSKYIPDLVTSGLSTVAIRAPNHEVAMKLIENSGYSLCAPSANRFGRISPTNAQAVFEELHDRIPFILDGGDCAVGLESTVISIDEFKITVLRPGAITKEMIQNATGLSVVERNQLGLNNKSVESPGLLENHYAPSKPLLLIKQNEIKKDLIENKIFKLNKKFHKVSLLLNNDSTLSHWKDVLVQFKIIDAFYLNVNSDHTFAAKHFFNTLRMADHSISDLIIAEQYDSDDGIAHAICDRLFKASTKI